MDRFRLWVAAPLLSVGSALRNGATIGGSGPVRKDDSDGSIASLVSRMADGMGKLVSQHLALAKLELTEDAKAVGGEVAKVAVFLPFVLVGYALLMVALSVVLARWLGLAGGFAVVGGLNLAGGAAAAGLAVARLRSRKLLTGTVTELERTSERLTAPGQNLLESNHGKR